MTAKVQLPKTIHTVKDGDGSLILLEYFPQVEIIEKFSMRKDISKNTLKLFIKLYYKVI